jgi:hypothetical protein
MLVCQEHGREIARSPAYCAQSLLDSVDANSTIDHDERRIVLHE